MESPPNSSTLSEPFMLSDDSGLLLTSGSLSSGSMSGESHSYGPFGTEMQDSDCEDKSFSQTDSLDGMSDIICGEHFNTLKKMPHWMETSECRLATPIEPPPEFQDKPNSTLYENLADNLIQNIISEGIAYYCRTIEISPVISPIHWSGYQALTSSYWTSEFLPFGSPPSSRRSLVSSRLSSSHNSLSVPAAHKVDDSSFIMQAVSHDTLVSAPISDMYNVPFDSDMYSVPIDVVRFPEKHKRNQHKKKRRNTSSCCQEYADQGRKTHQKGVKRYFNYVKCNHILEEDTDSIAKRHSVAGSSAPVQREPIHMTLQEVRDYLHTLYSSSSDSSVYKDKELNVRDSIIISNSNSGSTYNNKYLMHGTNNGCSHKFKKGTLVINIKNNQIKNNNNNCDSINNKEQNSVIKSNKQKKCNARISSFKQTLCNLFRFKKFVPPTSKKPLEEVYTENILMVDKEGRIPITNRDLPNRALPPLPSKMQHEDQGLDFSTSIRKVKDYGWYWGPISSETAEKILSNEPDGSFIVRDSSDDHYIFSLTFKLNNSVRHVRIEHDQGNFSFGSCTKFKSQTIVEFIENAVEHSRSGRYLFFLHRRPVIGPVRVQLLHPVSRFKQIQSLQHMCRFVVLKLVRRDLLTDLPLPRRMVDYLNTPYYYSEHLIDEENEKGEGISSYNVSSNNSAPVLYNTANRNLNGNIISNGTVSSHNASIIEHDYISRQS